MILDKETEKYIKNGCLKFNIDEDVNESLLTEGKQDREALINWLKKSKDLFGDDAIYNGQESAYVDYFFTHKDEFKSPYNDLYYWIKNAKQSDFTQFISDKRHIHKSKEDVKGGAKLIYNDSSWKVYEISTYEAAAKYGKNTKWCIAGSKYWSNGENGKDYFDNYSQQGLKFYFFIRSNVEKYALCVHRSGDVEIFNSLDVKVGFIPDAPSIDALNKYPYKMSDINTFNGMITYIDNAVRSGVLDYNEVCLYTNIACNNALIDTDNVDLQIFNNVKYFVSAIMDQVPQEWLSYFLLCTAVNLEKDFSDKIDDNHLKYIRKLINECPYVFDGVEDIDSVLTSKEQLDSVDMDDWGGDVPNVDSVMDIAYEFNSHIQNCVNNLSEGVLEKSSWELFENWLLSKYSHGKYFAIYFYDEMFFCDYIVEDTYDSFLLSILSIDIMCNYGWKAIIDNVENVKNVDIKKLPISGLSSIITQAIVLNILKTGRANLDIPHSVGMKPEMFYAPLKGLKSNISLNESMSDKEIVDRSGYFKTMMGVYDDESMRCFILPDGTLLKCARDEDGNYEHDNTVIQYLGDEVDSNNTLFNVAYKRGWIKVNFAMGSIGLADKEPTDAQYKRLSEFIDTLLWNGGSDLDISSDSLSGCLIIDNSDELYELDENKLRQVIKKAYASGEFKPSLHEYLDKHKNSFYNNIIEESFEDICMTYKKNKSNKKVRVVEKTKDDEELTENGYTKEEEEAILKAAEGPFFTCTTEEMMEW